MNALIPVFIYLCIFATSYRFYACLFRKVPVGFAAA